jgi:NAD dependent epimerase/dehydratase family
VTFRQSCIYGTRQFGIEDQGWVAWLTIAAVLGKKITIYGDGKQTRDVLHVQLARAYEAAFERREAVTGQAFNIGGGPSNAMSLLDSSVTSNGNLILVFLYNGVIGGPEISPYLCAISKRRGDFSNGSPKFSCVTALANLSAGCAITKSYSTV